MGENSRPKTRMALDSFCTRSKLYVERAPTRPTTVWITCRWRCRTAISAKCNHRFQRVPLSRSTFNAQLNSTDSRSRFSKLKRSAQVPSGPYLPILSSHHHSSIVPPMIIEKQPLPEDPVPTELPPSYETLSAINADYPLSKRSELTLVDHLPSSSSPRSPLNSAPPIKSPSITSSTSGSSKGKGRAANWFNFAASRTTREVRNTVLGLIRDLVQEQYSSFPAATGILQSCADACTTHSLSLSSILQEKSIENHTPLYWAIVKRLPDEHHQVEDSSGPDLLSALLSYSTPLSPATITDVRRACLATCDQRLFQRLRLSPEFAPVSGVDQMLLGGTIPPDNIEVEDVPGDGGVFVVNFEIPHFHKRMVVSKEIGLEFIARNRMWRLEFSIAPENGYDSCRPGSWCISLSLLETSPPTWIDSRLIIPEATSPSADHHSDHHLNPPLSASSRFKLPPSNASKPKPAIELKLESNEQLEVARRGQPPKRITVTLQDSLLGAHLQYGKNPYVGLDETLRARLEARLGKPGADCIIC